MQGLNEWVRDHDTSECGYCKLVFTEGVLQFCLD